MLEDMPVITVFVTAYDQFAIKAIKANAFDYLLKPISIKELKQVETKLNKAIHLKKNEEVQKDENQKKIVFAINNSYIIENLDNIIYLHSESSYIYL
ncbi:MAG: response regulator [Flavobacteriaceae bacterium]|nr:MAG: response regulator [Flavobacteriaceae bacterium]